MLELFGRKALKVTLLQVQNIIMNNIKKQTSFLQNILFKGEFSFVFILFLQWKRLIHSEPSKQNKSVKFADLCFMRDNRKCNISPV